MFRGQLPMLGSMGLPHSWRPTVLSRSDFEDLWSWASSGDCPCVGKVLTNDVSWRGIVWCGSKSPRICCHGARHKKLYFAALNLFDSWLDVGYDIEPAKGKAVPARTG